MLTPKVTLSKATELRREDKLEQLERILHSRAMQGSENLKSFLKFIVLKCIDDSNDLLKEYIIATEVFGRGDDFSPRNDSIVRVQASRLRVKLQEYYATEGKSDKILIDLPKGHYVPVFSPIDGSGLSDQPTAESAHLADAVGVRPTPEIAVDSPSYSVNGGAWLKAIGTALVVLIIAVVLLVVANKRPNIQPDVVSRQTQGEGYGPVWEPFLREGSKTLLVLSNPAVFRFTNPIDSEALLKNSVRLTPRQIEDVNQAVGDKFMIKHSGGRLILSADQFTGIGESIGLARITHLFSIAGKDPLLKQSRTVSGEDLKNHDIILLGSVWVNEWSGKLPINEHFTYTSSATIVNNNPQQGEDREYRPTFDGSGRLVEDYGLITVKPNISYRNTVMVVAGIYSEGTEAAAEYITNLDYLKTLNDRLRQLSGDSGPPKYYQALLRVAVDNGIPTTISLVTVHELEA